MRDHSGRRRTRPPLRRLVALLILGASIGTTSGLVAPERPRQPDVVTDHLTAAVVGSGTGGLQDGSAEPTDSDESTQDPGGSPPPGAVSAPVLGPIPSGAVSVPILMYHYVRINPRPGDRLGFNLSVTPADLDRQLSMLAAHGFHTITLSDLMDALDRRRGLPDHPIILTFDDGYQDFASSAVPILVRHHMVATDYVVSGFLGRPGYMSAQDVLDAQSKGMVIGAHTVHHVDLTRVPLAVARAEISQSKADLEALLGHPVPDFAYPAGGVNTPVAAFVREAGFRDSVTTVPGSIHDTGQQQLLTRVRVSGGESLADFAASVGLPQTSAPSA